MNIILIVGTILVCGILYYFNKKWLGIFYLLTCMWTEFLYINIAGGKLRMYHFAAIFILLLLIKEGVFLLRKKAIRHIAFFVLAAIVTALLSFRHMEALKSVSSLLLNCATGAALLLLLKKQWMNWNLLLQTICYGVIGSSLVGVLQYIMKAARNINIGFSAEQCTQIEIGMIPGLSTEANVFGRYLIVYMVLLLSVFVERKQKIIGIRIMYILGLFCTLMNMTRTVLYPTVGVLILMLLYYLKTVYRKRMLTVFFQMSVLSAIFIVLLLNGILPAGEYTLYKLKAFVSPLTISARDAIKEEAVVNLDSMDYEQQDYTTIDDINRNKAVEIKEKGNLAQHLKDVNFDVSASYRAGMSKLVLRSWMSDYRTLLLGKGWGQTYVLIDNVLVQAGAGDWINILVYTGIFGMLAWLVLTGKTFWILGKVIYEKSSCAGGGYEKVIALGTISACIIVGIAGLMSSNIIFPYFWQLVFISVYLNMSRENNGE